MLLWLCMGALALGSADARPVSYPKAWTAMSSNNKDQNSFAFHYTLDRTHALGYRVRYWRERKTTFHALQWNSLLKRWNSLRSQANAWWKSDIGLAQEAEGAQAMPSFLAALALDYETRRYYLAYEGAYIHFHHTIGKASPLEHQVRLGIAPVLREYNRLDPWLIAQAEYLPKEEKLQRYGVIARFFMNVYMIELGYRDDESMIFNGIVRF